jgi:aspartyl-tRNA(Asn)/glutamyl-tRNA(Gln) amidotransferase subunit C
MTDGRDRDPDRAAILRPVSTLSRRDVEHVAHLARLGLDEAELSLFEAQLNHILDQYAILATLPTDEIAPTAQTIELENILRDDQVTPCLTVDEALANAPERSGDYIVVPAILGDAASRGASDRDASVRDASGRGASERGASDR